MNYQRHYDLLIERARVRQKPEGYFEEHHIVPRCLGGSDDRSNLVRLTAEEHFLAHQLLVKLHPKVEKLAYAALLMTADAHGSRVCNKLYGWLKRKVAVAKSKEFSGKIWTEQQNKSRSERVKAQWADPSIRAKKISAMSGKKWAEERRKARSEAMKGVKPEHINNSGRVMSEEVKRKISATLKSKFSQTKLLKGAEL
jgi:hypothetical protein